VKQNPVSRVHQQEAAVDTKDLLDAAVEVLVGDSEAVWYKAVVLVVVAVRSMFLTFVISNPLRFISL
jgi:hypothetical protein